VAVLKETNRRLFLAGRDGRVVSVANQNTGWPGLNLGGAVAVVINIYHRLYKVILCYKYAFVCCFGLY